VGASLLAARHHLSTVPRPPVYRSDPGQAPDSAFEAGKLSHLVAGNTGRMLDARRTPVRIVSVDPRDGMFEVEICAFEDAGARWRIPLEEAGGYQFAHGSERVGAAALAELRDACARLDRTLLIEANPDRARASSLQLRSRRGPRGGSPAGSRESTLRRWSPRGRGTVA
jgi:hypothetical protein